MHLLALKIGHSSHRPDVRLQLTTYLRLVGSNKVGSFEILTWILDQRMGTPDRG